MSRFSPQKGLRGGAARRYIYPEEEKKGILEKWETFLTGKKI